MIHNTCSENCGRAGVRDSAAGGTDGSRAPADIRACPPVLRLGSKNATGQAQRDPGLQELDADPSGLALGRRAASPGTRWQPPSRMPSARQKPAVVIMRTTRASAKSRRAVARAREREFSSRGARTTVGPSANHTHFPLSSTGSLRHDHARTALADGNGHVCGTSQGPRRRGCKRQAASGRRQGSRLALPAHPPSRHLALGARVDFCDWSAVRPISGVEHAALCISGARQPPLLADPRAHPSQHRPSPAVGS